MAQPPITDLERLAPTLRSRPLGIVFTRYLPHFRYEVFTRLNEELPDVCELLFVHDLKVPARDTGVETAPLPNSVPVRLRYVCGEWHIQPKAIRIITKLNPDVFMTEASPYSITTHLCAILQRLRGKQVIYWTKGPSPKKRHPVRRWFLARAFRIWASAATMLVGYGQSSRRWFLQCGRREEDIVVAQNTIDTSVILGREVEWYEKGRALRERLGLSDDHVVIGTVSRLIKSKKVDMVIRVAGELVAAGRPVAVIVGGAGPDRERLESIAAEHPNLPVHFIGKLDIGEDNTVFAASDMNVFAGAIGLAIIQSMALRRLTICADEPFADAELLIHEKTGLRFRRFDAGSMKETIERAIDDSDLYKRVADEGHDYISAHATIENMAAQIGRAIKTAVSRLPQAPDQQMERAEKLCD